MKTLLMILLLCYMHPKAQPYTHIMHSDSLFLKNLATGDSTLLVNAPQATRMIKDSAKYGVTVSTIATALGYTPISGSDATNTGGWTTMRVAGSNATTTGQSLVDITGLVSGTLTNAALYEVEAVLYVNTSAVTTGCQYAILAGGTGAAAEVFAVTSGTTTTNAATTVTQAVSGTQVGTFLTTSNSNGVIVMKGFVRTRGGGTATISIQHLKVTSGTSTVRIGSVFRYRLIN